MPTLFLKCKHSGYIFILGKTERIAINDRLVVIQNGNIEWSGHAFLLYCFLSVKIPNVGKCISRLKFSNPDIGKLVHLPTHVGRLSILIVLEF